LIEQVLVLDAIEQARAQHRVEVTATVEAGDAQRLQRELHAVGAHRHAGAAQHPREVHDVLGETAGGRASDQHQAVVRAAALRTSSSSRAASPPCMRAMSSWYFSSTPSVSWITAGSSTTVSSS